MVASLDKKKYRVENGVFAVEGTKAVRDTWDYFSCRMIIATKQWYDSFGNSGHLGKIMFQGSAGAYVAFLDCFRCYRHLRPPSI